MASKNDTPSSPEHSTAGLEMAEEIKKDQGFHECEVSTSTDAAQVEADLHKLIYSCKKNPGHKDFIPVNILSIGDIPDCNGYRDENMLKFIRAMIDLTVCIENTHISKERPKFWPGTDRAFPFYNRHNDKCKIFGSGMVCSVVNYTCRMCPCKECENSLTPKTQWYMFVVNTALHVVFDNVEAENTMCLLFYDSDKEKHKIKKFKGNTMGNYGNINYDMCEMVCYIHDLELGKKLQAMLKDYQKLCVELSLKYLYSVIEHPLTVIVSHPHGCTKQVTIGQMTHMEDGYGRRIRYRYTAQTCRGSSGAPVYIIGKSGIDSLHPHSERCEEEGFNISGFWLY